MEIPIKLDDLGGKPHHFRKHPYNTSTSTRCLFFFQVERVHLQTTSAAWMNIANWLRSTLVAPTHPKLFTWNRKCHIRDPPYKIHPPKEAETRGATIHQPSTGSFTTTIFPDFARFGSLAPWLFTKHEALDELRRIAKPVTSCGQGERFVFHSLSLISNFPHQHRSSLKTYITNAYFFLKSQFFQRIHVVSISHGSISSNI